MIEPRGHLTLDEALLSDVVARVADDQRERTRLFPGDRTDRQPVHTCYVPADQATDDLPAEWGAAAVAALEEHAPTPAALAGIVGLPAEIAGAVHERVRAKLVNEPVEDVRIDFEDGYGVRDDDAEDVDALRAAHLLSRWNLPNAGIRMKSFHTVALAARGLRTLDLVLTNLTRSPEGVGLTFPKVTSADQVSAFADVLDVLERRLDSARGALRFEVQIETTQAVIDHAGRVAIPGLIAAGRGRVCGLHFGTYDYTAACGLGAAQQHLAHSACDFARHIMQVSAAGTGVRLSDGSTNVLPVGDSGSVREGWRTHYRLVRRSLEHGYFQGWDLHPVQLVTRYAAVFAHHLESAEADGRRLAAYLARAGGSVLDEPATAAGLALSLRRGVDCGALDAEEVRRFSGLRVDELTALVLR
ncbi:MAG: aldolase/citrate lyase family protein [Actinomycetota bacterium]|nr:aldolase/citrate lyase family protein [Actinomycetota bacterium]